MKESDIKILIVDDEELIRDIFHQALSNWGFNVETAQDGKTALDLCQGNTYHIIITDINMPAMDGMELLNRIKSRWPYIEVIVMTGYATIENAIEALKAGAFDFILKPVNFDHIKFTVKKCYQKIAYETEKTELREKNAHLREINEMKDKFLSITNHEIRTPLMIIKGYLDILETQIDNTSKEDREIFEILKKTTDNLTETVDRMHTLSEMTRGNYYGKFEKLDIREIAQKAYNDFSHLFHHRKITISLKSPETPLLIMANPYTLELVIRELLHNALKFTQDGGEVKIAVLERQNQVVLVVKDNGIGIPLDKQSIIFSGFYEIQDVMNHKSSSAGFMGGGMGIGLSLVKEILTTMKGKIELFSEPGKGSSFFIFFPKYSANQINHSNSSSKQPESSVINSGSAPKLI